MAQHTSKWRHNDSSAFIVCFRVFAFFPGNPLWSASSPRHPHHPISGDIRSRKTFAHAPSGVPSRHTAHPPRKAHRQLAGPCAGRPETAGDRAGAALARPGVQGNRHHLCATSCRAAPRGSTSRKRQCAHRGPAAVSWGRGLGALAGAIIVRQGTRPGNERQLRRQMTQAPQRKERRATGEPPRHPVQAGGDRVDAVRSQPLQVSHRPVGNRQDTRSLRDPRRKGPTGRRPPRSEISTDRPRRTVAPPTRSSERPSSGSLGRGRQCRRCGDAAPRRRNVLRPTRSPQEPCQPGQAPASRPG